MLECILVGDNERHGRDRQTRSLVGDRMQHTNSHNVGLEALN